MFIVDICEKVKKKIGFIVDAYKSKKKNISLFHRHNIKETTMMIMYRKGAYNK